MKLSSAIIESDETETHAKGQAQQQTPLCLGLSMY